MTGEGQGNKKRAASDSSSSNSSSRSGNNVKANHESTSAKVVLAKRRQQSGRQGNVLERHRHHSVSGMPGGAQRAGARERAARYQGTREQGQAVDEQRGGEWHDDEDATNPRRDIQARLIRSPEVIMAATWANRPQQTRAATDKYQAGTKTGPKTPGRGRGR